MSKYYVLEKNSTFVIYNNFADLKKRFACEPELTFKTFETLKSACDYVRNQSARNQNSSNSKLN